MPESSLAAVLTRAETPLVAFNHERVAVLNPVSGAVAVVDLARVLRRARTTFPLRVTTCRASIDCAGEAGVELREPADDTSIMAFLVDSISGHYDLADVALRFLGEPIEDTRPSLFSASSDETLVRDVQQIARLRDVLARRDRSMGAQSHLRRGGAAPRRRAGPDGSARDSRRRAAAAHDLR